MRNVGLAVLGGIFLFALADVAQAQGWPGWADDAFGNRRPRMDRGWRDQDKLLDPQERPQTLGGDLRDGGPRPDIAPTAPPVVAFTHTYPANSIVIDTGARKLYYVLPDKRAYQYSISVGREGFNWTGTETISRKQAWPDWHPPAEMRERDPSLPEKMTGGLKNPLGAMALYLGNTLYRIHGTNDVKSIGQAQSSGCFRMLNSSVMHLASIAEIGTSVSVVPSLPAPQAVSANSPPPASAPTRPAPQVTTQPEPPQATSQPVPQIRAQPAPPAPSPAPASAPDYRSLRDYALGQR